VAEATTWVAILAGSGAMAKSGLVTGRLVTDGWATGGS
jgi:hypothetical protein